MRTSSHSRMLAQVGQKSSISSLWHLLRANLDNLEIVWVGISMVPRLRNTGIHNSTAHLIFASLTTNPSSRVLETRFSQIWFWAPSNKGCYRRPVCDENLKLCLSLLGPPLLPPLYRRLPRGCVFVTQPVLQIVAWKSSASQILLIINNGNFWQFSANSLHWTLTYKTKKYGGWNEDRSLWKSRHILILWKILQCSWLSPICLILGYCWTVSLKQFIPWLFPVPTRNPSPNKK